MNQSLLPSEPADTGGTPPATPPATPPQPATPPVDATPPAPPAQESQRFGQQPPADGTPPEPPAEPPAGEVEITDEIRERVLTQLREGVPETPDAYELPAALFEGKEGDDLKAAQDEINSSPLMKRVREAAHKAGMKPEEFQEFVSGYFEEEARVASEAYDAERKQLGANDEAIKKRVGDLTGAIQRTLPADEAQALIALTTTAASVRALERLINRTPATTAATPPAPADDWPTIEALMNSDKYMGYNPDPSVVARVDRYFANGGKRGGKA